VNYDNSFRDISKAAEILNEENLVAIPTETVGLEIFIAK
jgi:tRNA A37 threonylcarbamoyladenosine synthetase subunit TsaC/SUA5/YrdC